MQPILLRSPFYFFSSLNYLVDGWQKKKKRQYRSYEYVHKKNSSISLEFDACVCCYYHFSICNITIHILCPILGYIFCPPFRSLVNEKIMMKHLCEMMRNNGYNILFSMFLSPLPSPAPFSRFLLVRPELRWLAPNAVVCYHFSHHSIIGSYLMST